MSLLLLSLAPVFILLAYVYMRDKYEKEPLRLLFEGVFAGGILLFPVAAIEQGLSTIVPAFQGIGMAAYDGFVVAGFTEEVFKFLVLFFLFWRNRNFNERYDGIVYAVSVSLGFAAVENIFYVYKGSYQVGLLRAFTAVPAHMIFGILMGYYLGMAKFQTDRRRGFLWKAILVPWLFHGTYDFLLLSKHLLFLLVFIPFLFIMWRTGLKRMKLHVDSSFFRIAPPPPQPGHDNYE
ncbi:MAG: PrsW family intramembrane metalloprotease [Bacteroidetes bacterium]|nr:PrsW family intramembrane metalloprotease [Bacteroidota bacterium]